MNGGRREFLLGLGSALVTGAAGYAGYVWVKGRGCEEQRSATSLPEPAHARPWVQAAIGTQVSAAWLNKRSRLSRPLFDPAGSERFGALREHLVALAEPEAELLVEVRRQGERPYLARVWVRLDRGEIPSMYAEDRESYERAARVDPMPRRHGPTAIYLSADETVIERREQTTQLGGLEGAEARGGRWDGAMWTLANRGGITRLHGRRPYLFVDDALRWEQLVSAIEALAPVRCQPHKPRPRACEGPWVTLFLGPGRRPPATIG